MKLYHLIHKHAWDDVHAALVRLYPDHESELEGYEEVFNKLKALTPVDSEYQLRIDLVYSESVGEYQLETTSMSPTQTSGKTGSLFILEFTPWSKWLGMELDPHTLEKFSEFDIIAHCMYEMTFFGFTQEDIKTAAVEITEKGK